jgi:hypothetical protein
MTERLRDNPDELNVLVMHASAALGIPAAYVEKDFWVTEVLRAASKTRIIGTSDGSTTDVLFVFKGGTSLSRVFKLINRFSEDVDLLAVFSDGMTPTSRHSILKLVDADVTAHLGLTAIDVEVTSSTTGVKRYTTYNYPTDTRDDDIREGVLLELGSRGGAQPASQYPYRSLVAEHAFTLGDDETTWDEFAPFSVWVLAPERTLLEKVAAVHDAATRIDTEGLLKHGRHFYDIYQLLNDDRVRDALQSLGPDGITALVEDINAHSDAAGFSWSPRPEGGYANSPAFDPEHSAAEIIATGYRGAQNLIHGEQITLDEVSAAVKANRLIL